MYILDGLLVWFMLLVSTCVRTFEILSGQLDIMWSMHQCKFFLKNVGSWLWMVSECWMIISSFRFFNSMLRYILVLVLSSKLFMLSSVSIITSWPSLITF